MRIRPNEHCLRGDVWTYPFKEKGAGHSHADIKKKKSENQSALIELKLCIVLQKIIADRMVLLSTPNFHFLCEILEHLE